MLRARTSALAALLAIVACGDGPTRPGYDPQLDPADFVRRVTNPFFPLTPGRHTSLSWRDSRWLGDHCHGRGAQPTPGPSSASPPPVVHDRVFLDGELIEDTFDWYAQQSNGDVWYLGEDSKEIEDGEVVSTAGSWEAGVDGAKPGIIMWGDPAAHLNEEYKQEYYQGVAEDVAR